MGEIAVSDREDELWLIDIDVLVCANDVHARDAVLGGNREDLGRVREEELAEVSRGGSTLAEVVVADEQEGALGVVEGVADDVVEGGSYVDAAVWHEVVDVVDDDECWLESSDLVFNILDDSVVVLAEDAEHVKAEEVEVSVVEREVLLHLSVELHAVVGAVYGVDPEYCAWIGWGDVPWWRWVTGVDLQRRGVVVAACDDRSC